MREYFKSKKAKLDDSINIADIPEHLRDLIKNLDSLYTSDIAEGGMIVFIYLLVLEVLFTLISCIRFGDCLKFTFEFDNNFVG